MFRSAEISPGNEAHKESPSNSMLLAEMLVVDRWNVLRGNQRLREEQKPDSPDKPAGTINREGSISFGSTNDNRKPFDTTNPTGRSDSNIDITIKKIWNF